ncbi:hypothetical protein EI534_25920 [Pseudomonas frederiksbergensis]|nr:hypothetical protein [Pseudomonas frederiksbergensis]
MADNELDLYSNGGVAPYSPSQPLAPAPDWNGNTELTNREIDEYHSGAGQTVFGQPLPPGVTIAQATQIYKQLGDVFSLDFMKLGYTITQTQKCVSWFLNAVTNPPAKEQKRHSFELFEHKSDPVFQAWANYAFDQGFSQKLVSDCCWWVTEASKRLNAQQLGTVQGHQVTAHGRAPIQTTGGSPDDLDGATYDRLYDFNEKQKPHCEDVLRKQWGAAYESNRRMVDNYLQSLSDVEKRHFDCFLNNGLHALNDPTVIMGLYGQAIGINNLPRGGVELANEINLMHDAMKNNRKQWLADERLQSRYRELIRIRDGG